MESPARLPFSSLTQRPRAPAYWVSAGSVCPPADSRPPFGFLSEPLALLGPPGAHLFTHCELSARLCQAPFGAGD